MLFKSAKGARVAKDPNKSPDKGFSQEVVGDKQLPASKPKTAFTWHKVVAPGSAEPTQSMATPKRLSEHKAVGRPKSNFVSEAQKRLNDRKIKG